MDTSAILGVAAPFAALGACAVTLALASRKVRILSPTSRKQPKNSAKAEKPSPISDAIERYSEMTGDQFSPSEIAAIWAAATFLPCLVGLMMGFGAVSLVFGAAGAAAVPVWAQSMRKKQARRFEDMLGQTMPLIASNLRAGVSVTQAIAPVAANMGEPIKSEFARLAAEVNGGTPMPDALDAMAARTKSADLKLFATAVAISQQSGGSLGDITDRVGETVRARTEMRAFIRAKTSLNRIESMILSGLPVLIFCVLMVISQTHREFYLTPTGFVVLGICLLMDLVGLVFIRKMGDIKTD